MKNLRANSRCQWTLGSLSSNECQCTQPKIIVQAYGRIRNVLHCNPVTTAIKLLSLDVSFSAKQSHNSPLVLSCSDLHTINTASVAIEALLQTFQHFIALITPSHITRNPWSTTEAMQKLVTDPARK
eukprot:764330-Hanusia_phi.AAC.1